MGRYSVQQEKEKNAPGSSAKVAHPGTNHNEPSVPLSECWFPDLRSHPHPPQPQNNHTTTTLPITHHPIPTHPKIIHQAEHKHRRPVCSHEVTQRGGPGGLSKTKCICRLPSNVAFTQMVGCLPKPNQRIPTCRKCRNRESSGWGWSRRTSYVCACPS